MFLGIINSVIKKITQLKSEQQTICFYAECIFLYHKTLFWFHQNLSYNSERKYKAPLNLKYQSVYSHSHSIEVEVGT